MSEPIVNGENSQSPQNQKENITKHFYRQKVWDHLVKNNLAIFPPPYGRIPNFKGTDEAAAKLLTLQEFQTSKNVEVNPDKPQEAVRVLVLENNKSLYVPVPRLKEGLLKHVVAGEGASKNEIRESVTRRGLDNGKTIGIEDNVSLDLLVVGSVAVSKEGYRIGKGRGYADLEYAVLLSMKAITVDTVIVTVVHDCQVHESLPKELFQPFDMPVDVILTPTQVIQVEKRLPRPTGIFWNLLSKRKLSLMPVLQALKDKQESEGKETTLKEVDTDVESFEPRTRFKRLRKYKRPRSQSKAAESQNENGSGENVKPRRFPRVKRFSRRRSTNRQSDYSTKADETETEGEQVQSVTRKPNPKGLPSRKNFDRRRNFRRNRFQVDFSLMVGNIERNVRVRDLKKALNDHGIKPNEIIWQGYKGFCYLHYAKNGGGGAKGPQEHIVVDNVIEILQTLKITPESDTNLSVKVMEPISRIETTDVTAV